MDSSSVNLDSGHMSFHPMGASHPSPNPALTYERGSVLGRMGTTFNGGNSSSSEFACKCGRLVTNNALNASSLYLIYNIISLCLVALSLSPLPLSSLSLYSALLALPGLYNFLNIACGWMVHIASIPSFHLLMPGNLEYNRSAKFIDDRKNIAKRMSVRVNGSLVDVVVAGKKEHEGTGRYILFAMGNAMLYENVGGYDYFLTLAGNLQALALFYNYPGVGRSEGWFADREATCAAHVAMHRLLRNESHFPTTQGTKKVIVDFGWSIGGGVQESARPVVEQEHPEQCVVFVKLNTFSSLYKCARGLHLFSWLAWLVPILNWEYPPSANRKERSAQNREVVIQRGDSALHQNGSAFVPMSNLGELRDDGVIKKEASFAYTFFPHRETNEIKFFLTKYDHCICAQSQKDFENIAGIINDSINEINTTS